MDSIQGVSVLCFKQYAITKQQKSIVSKFAFFNFIRKNRTFCIQKANFLDEEQARLELLLFK